jgi:hypothetical protein
MDFTPSVGGDGESIGTCGVPYKNWTGITFPFKETTGGAQLAVSRGIVFSRARWKYLYTLRDYPTGSTDGFYNVLLIRSALVISPQDNGSPFTDADGNLPALFKSQGDLGDGLRIIWRSLDRLSNNWNQAPGYSTPQINVQNAHVPLERFNGSLKLNETDGLFWVTEIVAANPSPAVHVALDVTMSYRLGNL